MSVLSICYVLSAVFCSTSKMYAKSNRKKDGLKNLYDIVMYLHCFIM